MADRNSPAEGDAPASPARRSLSRRIGFPAAAIFLALLLTGTVLEIALRVAGYTPAYVHRQRANHETDPVVGHRGKRGYRGRFVRPEFDVMIIHTEDGFRRQEFQADLSSAIRRVFVFGDSFTWGWGVQQGEVYTDRLSRLLPNHFVANYGINGSGTTIQYTLFETECLARLRPGDVVVVQFCLNDFDDNINPRRLHGEIVGGRVRTAQPTRPMGKRVSSFFKDHCYLINLLAYLADSYRLERRLERRRARAFRRAKMLAVPGAESPEMIVTKHYLKQFRDRCGEKGVRFLPVYTPELGEMSGRADGDETAAFRRAFLHCAKELDLDALDPTEEFREAARASGKPLHYEKDGHWRAEGHEVIARILARRLRQVEKPVAPPATQ